MALPMNDMLGMLMGMMNKRMTNQDPGGDLRKGPGSMEVPWRLGGSIRNKGVPTSSSGAAPGTEATPLAYGAMAPGARQRGDIERMDYELQQLRDQLTQVQSQLYQAIRTGQERNAEALRAQVADIQERIRLMTDQISATEESVTGAPSRVLGMGTTSMQGMPGGMNREQRRVQTQEEGLAGRPWRIRG